MSRANADWLVQGPRRSSTPRSTTCTSRSCSSRPTRTCSRSTSPASSTEDLPDLFQPEDTDGAAHDRQPERRARPGLRRRRSLLARCSSCPGSRRTSRIDKVLYGMPWSLSNPILWYNRGRVREGRDSTRTSRPRPSRRSRSTRRRSSTSGAAKYGIALRVEPYIFEFLNAKSGGTLVNNGNGRDAAHDCRDHRDPDCRHRSGRGGRTWSTASLALNTGGAAGQHRSHARGRQRATPR